MRKIMSIILNKKVLIPLILVGGILIVVSGWRSCNSSATMVYTYDKVTRGDIKKTISVSGKLELFESYTVNSMIQGQVAKLFADFNDKVVQGQLLAVIDSPSVDESIRSHAETMKAAQLELDNQREFLASKKRLLDENLISKREYETSERNYQKAVSAFNQTKIAWDRYQEALRNKSILAPVAGIVIQRWAELRGPVGAGTPMFLITPTLKTMKLIINIDESDIGLVHPGQSVDFTVSAYPDIVFSGKIEQVRMHPVPKGAIVTYESMVICSNPDNLLRPGMTVTATVNVDERKNVLRIPNQAFVVSPKDMEMEPGKKYVWKKSGVTLDSIPMTRYEVQPGLIGDYFTEVRGGEVKEGEEVLVGMHQKLEVKDELSSYEE